MRTIAHITGRSDRGRSEIRRNRHAVRGKHRSDTAVESDPFHSISNLTCVSANASTAAQGQKATARTTGLRSFGRFALRQLIGRSSLTMAWMAHDTRSRRDVLLLIARQAIVEPVQLAESVDAMRRAARLEHPRLLHAIETGARDSWPYLVCECPPGAQVVSQFLAARLPPPHLEAAGWSVDALEGLAYLHDAGLAHGDLGLHSLLIDKNGRVLVWGTALQAGVQGGGSGFDSELLRQQRAAGERDVLAIGLLLYQWVAQVPALDEPDMPTAIARLGHDIVRLPWTLPQPVPEALRAIINRATDRHAHRRYLGARSLERALSGWCQVQASDRGGALALLIDRLRTSGHLPALPGLAQRVVQLSRMETQRIDELTDVVLEDPALSFELLHTVNAAKFRGCAEEGVTTVRRAIQLIGISGVRRAAGTLRSWPGHLKEPAAQALEQALKLACLAGHLADVLSPGGLDAEGALLAAQLQHLGRLLVRYHFPDEAIQITALMQPSPPLQEGEAATPGLSEEAAAMAVLGVDLASMANAMAKHWGFDESVQDMMQPLPLRQAVHMPISADGWMRVVASCANETLATLKLNGPMQTRAFTQVANRYAKTLSMTPDKLKLALQEARVKLNRHLSARAA
jgi:non-specific serine/threonine protein kinase